METCTLSEVLTMKQLQLFEDNISSNIIDREVVDISKIDMIFIGDKEMHRKSNIMIEKLKSIEEGKYYIYKNRGNLPYVTGTKGQKLSISTTRNQYPCVGVGGVVVAMHRLVALAFIENDNTTTKLEVDHINDDKYDYSVENLQWVTNGFNSKKAQKKKKNAI